MSKKPSLILQVISGPLDGLEITLTHTMDLSTTGQTPLSFPWDDELGAPQATFGLEDGHWTVTAHDSPHHTYRINTEEMIKGKILLAKGDVLKASRTWLIVINCD